MANFFGRGGDNSNTIIGIILLVLLLVFVGPNVLPGLIADTFPFIDEGVPCSRLRNAQNRSQHQSLIGRSSIDPITLRVEPDTVPQDTTSSLNIRIVVINNTIGTIPIIYDPNQVIVGDNGSSGVGIIITPATPLTTGANRQNQNINSFPEDQIRLLGPRQRCIHRLTFPANQIDQTIRTGSATAQAYYRVNTTGQNQGGNLIFPDQGLQIIQGGIVTSRAEIIPIASQAN